MLRSEQKRLRLMKTLVGKYSQPGDVVYDPLAGAYTTARACLSLLLHRRCTLGDKWEDCNKYAMTQLVDVFARQLLNPESDRTVTTDMEDATWFLEQKMDVINVKRANHVWWTAQGYPPLKQFPPEVVRFLCPYHQDYTLYHHGRQLALNRRSTTYRACFNELDTKALLAYELSMARLEFKKSKIPNAGHGLFTTVPIGENEVIGYLYGTLV